MSQNGQSITLNVQDLAKAQKYLVGMYDLEILTLPRIYKKDVKINQSAFTYINIPGSGLLKYRCYQPIVGQVFINDNAGQDQWVCDFDSEKLTDNFYLQPGKYKVVYRLKTAVSTDYTSEKVFSIDAGENTTINL